jgi:hypothetical protein
MHHKSESADAERVGIDKAMSILGLKRRNIQAKAARGEIPGAVKIGHLWTFNLAKLREYVKQEEERQWRQSGRRRQADAFGVVIPFGVASISTVARSGDRYRQATRKLRHSDEKQRKSA